MTGTMVTITFIAQTEVCNVASLVTFRTHTPPTQLTQLGGIPVPLARRICRPSRSTARRQ